MNKSGVYIIKNMINNKSYIGSAIDLELRKKHHLVYGNKYSNIKLQNAIKKYGVENFEFSVLEYVEDKNFLIKREQYWIDYINPEYNIAKIAGNTIGVLHTEEIKKNISQKLKGNNNFNSSCKRDIAIKKISQTKKEQYKNGYIHPFLNKIHTNETKEQLSEIRKNNREKSSKLNIVQVKEMRKMLNEGISVKNISKLYNISLTMVYDIKNYKKWKDIY